MRLSPAGAIVRVLSVPELKEPRDMRSTPYHPAPGRAAQILHESAIVARAIARHRRKATLQGRTEEAHEMEALHSGVCRMALEVVRPYQSVAQAA